MRIFRFKLIDDLIDVCENYRRLASHQAEMLVAADQTIQELRLEHARGVRDLVEQFFIAQMSGVDVTEDLEAGLSDMRDFVAQMEEHSN